MDLSDETFYSGYKHKNSKDNQEACVTFTRVNFATLRNKYVGYRTFISKTVYEDVALVSHFLSHTHLHSKWI